MTLRISADKLCHLLDHGWVLHGIDAVFPDDQDVIELVDDGMSLKLPFHQVRTLHQSLIRDTFVGSYPDPKDTL